jgi:hypothetical protein
LRDHGEYCGCGDGKFFGERMAHVSHRSSHAVCIR